MLTVHMPVSLCVELCSYSAVEGCVVGDQRVRPACCPAAHLQANADGDFYYLRQGDDFQRLLFSSKPSLVTGDQVVLQTSPSRRAAAEAPEPQDLLGESGSVSVLSHQVRSWRCNRLLLQPALQPVLLPRSLPDNLLRGAVQVTVPNPGKDFVTSSATVRLSSVTFLTRICGTVSQTRHAAP